MPEIRLHEPIHRSVNNFLNQASTTFNFLNSIPVIAIPFSCARIEIYKVATMASGTLAGVGLVGQLIQPGNRKWTALTNNTLDLTLHFSAEVVRGYLERIAAFTVIGSSVLFTAQFLSKNEFRPIFDYNTKISDYLFSHRT